MVQETADWKGDFSTIFLTRKGTYDKNISFSGTIALKRRFFVSFFINFGRNTIGRANQTPKLSCICHKNGVSLEEK